MAQKNVTLRLEEEIYEDYKEFCKVNAIALSKSIENYMRGKLNNEK